MFRVDSIVVLIVESSLMRVLFETICVLVLARLSVHGILDAELVKEASKASSKAGLIVGIALCQGLLP
jgi:hypothetical protein